MGRADNLEAPGLRRRLGGSGPGLARLPAAALRLAGAEGVPPAAGWCGRV